MERLSVVVNDGAPVTSPTTFFSPNSHVSGFHLYTSAGRDNEQAFCGHSEQELMYVVHFSRFTTLMTISETTVNVRHRT